MGKKGFLSKIANKLKFQKQTPLRAPALRKRKPRGMPPIIPPIKPLKSKRKLSPELRKVIGQHNIPRKRVVTVWQVKGHIQKAKDYLRAKNLKNARLSYNRALVFYHKLSDIQQREIDPEIREFELLLEKKSFTLSMDQLHTSISEDDLFKAKDEIRRMDFGLT